MKEFDFNYKKIFSGLHAQQSPSKREPELEECHNLEPLGGDYNLHEFVIDLNSGAVAVADWGIGQGGGVIFTPLPPPPCPDCPDPDPGPGPGPGPDPPEVEYTLLSSDSNTIFEAEFIGDVLYGINESVIYKWEPGDSGWSMLANASPKWVQCSCFHDGRIFFGTQGNVSTGIDAELLEWDGGSGFDVVGSYLSLEHLRISSMVSFNGDLYVGTWGSSGGINPTPESGNLLKWNGSNSLSVVATSPYWGLRYMVVCDNTLYAIAYYSHGDPGDPEPGDLLRFNGSSLILEASMSAVIPDDYHVWRTRVHNNKIYVVVQASMDLTADSYFLVWDGSGDFTLAAPTFDPVNNLIYSLGVVNGKLFAGLVTAQATMKAIIIQFNESAGEWELYVDLYAEGLEDPLIVLNLLDHAGIFYVITYSGWIISITYPT